jgi:hypothetical protein
MIGKSMKEPKDNPTYQKLLQRYHELQEEMDNLENNRELFKFEIILDSGTVIYPDYKSAYYRYKGEIEKIREHLKNIENE